MNTRPIKVLHIIDTLGMGGAETWLMEVLRHWSKNGNGQMDFLATSGNQGIFDAEARQLGAKIHYVRYGRRHLIRFAREFRRILRNEQYEAIHDHQDYTSGWHFLMGVGVLPPVRVTHVHNPSYQIYNNYGVTLSRRLTASLGKMLVARYTSHIAGTSRQLIAEYGFDAPSFRRIPKAALYCGFDPTRFLGNIPGVRTSVCHEFDWPKDTKIILFVGRIDQSSDLVHSQNHKNSAYAVSVGIECAYRVARMRMLLVGAPSPAVPVLKQRIATAGFTDRIKFLEIRQDIERLMIASDILLFPSRGEGLGMVAVEAQAAGLPVLASSNVPRECVVVPQLVRFQKLEAGTHQWADDLLELATFPRRITEPNQRVTTSAFAIKNSVQALLRLYHGEALA